MSDADALRAVEDPGVSGLKERNRAEGRGYGGTSAVPEPPVPLLRGEGTAGP